MVYKFAAPRLHPHPVKQINGFVIL